MISYKDVDTTVMAKINCSSQGIVVKVSALKLQAGLIYQDISRDLNQINMTIYNYSFNK